MKTIDLALDQFLQEVRALQKRRVEAALTEMKGEDSIRSTQRLLLGRNATFLAEALPEITLSTFAAVVEDDDIANAERRLRQCARCPEGGGECARPEERDWGKEPYWDETIRYRYCGKWHEHILRERLGEYGVPERMRAKTLTNFLADTESAVKAKKRVTEFLSNYETFRKKDMNGFLFSGSHGVGKTHIAAAILRALVERRILRSACFVPAITLTNNLRADGDVRPIVEHYARVDMLVVDDLGAQRTTPWVREQLGQIIDDRWSNQRPIICTSNGKLSACQGMLGERAFSRLNSMVNFVQIEGRDRRVPEQPADA